MIFYFKDLEIIFFLFLLKIGNYTKKSLIISCIMDSGGAHFEDTKRMSWFDIYYLMQC